uniref:Wsv118 n=1 Tax=White spot syndrome virus TaxID=92652 RepID=A0A2U9GD49_WSSV|nr:wsv118 [Shrimp white spot syndrome virus]
MLYLAPTPTWRWTIPTLLGSVLISPTRAVDLYIASEFTTPIALMFIYDILISAINARRPANAKARPILVKRKSVIWDATNTPIPRTRNAPAILARETVFLNRLSLVVLLLVSSFRAVFLTHSSPT